MQIEFRKSSQNFEMITAKLKWPRGTLISHGDIFLEIHIQIVACFLMNSYRSEIC